MKKLINYLMMLTIMSMLSVTAYSQVNTPVASWVKRSYVDGGTDAGYSIAYDASGNIYVVGSVNSEFNLDPAGTSLNLFSSSASQSGSTDVYVAKYNSAGQNIWAFYLGNTGINEFANKVRVDNNGYVYVMGKFSTTSMDMDPSSNTNNITNAGVDDIFLAKYDGNYLPSSTSFYKWAFAIGSSNYDYGKDFALDAGGNIYLVGSTYGNTSIDMDPSSNTQSVSFHGNGYDIIIAKYDGTLTPASTSFCKWAFSLGSTDYEVANSIVPDSNGNFYICGNINYASGTDMDPSSNTNNLAGNGGGDAYIAKYNGTLTPASTSFYQWAFAIGSTNYEECVDIALRGNYLYAGGSANINTSTSIDFDPSSNTANVSGTYSSPSRDVFVAKYDISKLPTDVTFYKWAFISGYDNSDELISLDADTSGNIYVAANFTSSYIDVDPSSNYNYVNNSSSNYYDFYIAKYDASLTPSSTSFYKWGFSRGASNSDKLNDIVWGNNKLYCTGVASGGTFTTNPASGASTLKVSTNTDDLFALVYNLSSTPATNTFCTAGIVAGAGGSSAQIKSITRDAAGNIYVAGQFYNTALFGSGSNIVSVTGLGAPSMFVAKFTANGEPVWAFPVTSSISINNIIPVKIAVDANGYIYVSGSIYASSGNYDFDPSSNTGYGVSSNYTMFAAKYDGNYTPTSTSFYKWSTVIGATGYSALNDMKVDKNGYVYLAGYVSGSTFDADPSSNYNPITPAGSNDIFISKFDGNYTPSNTSFYKWATNIGGTSTEIAYALEVDTAGNVYVGGGFYGNTAVDADPSSNSYNLTPANTSNQFLAKYNGTLTPSNTGFFKWGFLISSAYYGELATLKLDSTANALYVGGTITGSADFDPSSNVKTFTASSTSYADACIIKYDVNYQPSDTSFYKWAFVLGNASSGERPVRLEMNSAGQLFVGLSFSGSSSVTVDLDPSSNTNNISTTNNYGNVVACYNTNVTPDSTAFYKWGLAIGGAGNNLGGVSAQNSNVIIAGSFYNGSTSPVDFQPGNGVYGVLSARNGAAYSSFMAKYIDGNVWVGGISNSWHTAANWTANNVPSSSDYAYIPSSGVTNEPTVSSNTTIAGLISDAGRTITINSSTALSVTGEVTNNGTITGSGKLALSGTQAQSISGTGTYSNLELNNSAGAANSGTINITDTYTPTSGTLATGGNLTLKSTVAGTARIAAGNTSGGYITGNITIERYIPGKRAFRFISHPFTSALSMSALTDNIDITGSGGSPFTTTVNNNPSAYYFNVSAGDNSTTGNNPGWTAFTASSTWAQYQAMRVLVRGAKGEGLSYPANSYTPSAVTIDMSGVPNQGNTTVNLTKGSGTNFVLVGNPFPSQVNMDAVSTSNVGSAFYIWDATQGTKGGYTSYTFGSSSFNLPSCGAFVTTLSANGSIVFEEADKTSSTAGTMFKTTAPANTVQLRLEDSTTFWDRLLLKFDDNAMATVDYPDAAKLYNPDMSFYTWSKDDSMLSIDARPYVDGEIIPLGLYSTLKKNFRIIAADFDMPLGTKLFLHDKFLNTTEEITGAGYEYWFSVDANPASWGDNRFELNTQGKPVNDIATVSNTKLKVKLVPNPATDNVTVYTEGNNGKQVLVTITNMMGTKVAEHYTTGSTTISLSNMAAGIYIVNISCGSETITQKLIKQ